MTETLGQQMGRRVPSYLAKWPSDVKQNGTQEKEPLSGTVFNTLSHDVLRFVASGSFKNH